jgi:hypothetical protein
MTEEEYKDFCIKVAEFWKEEDVETKWAIKKKAIRIAKSLLASSGTKLRLYLIEALGVSQDKIVDQFAKDIFKIVYEHNLGQSIKRKT